MTTKKQYNFNKAKNNAHISYIYQNNGMVTSIQYIVVYNIPGSTYIP